MTDRSRLKKETEPPHAGEVSPNLFKPEVEPVGDLARQEKTVTQSKTVDRRGSEKFVTDWFIE